MNIKENVERADVENKGIVIYSQHDKFRNLDNISKWKPATS